MDKEFLQWGNSHHRCQKWDTLLAKHCPDQTLQVCNLPLSPHRTLTPTSSEATPLCFGATTAPVLLHSSSQHRPHASPSCCYAHRALQPHGCHRCHRKSVRSPHPPLTAS